MTKFMINNSTDVWKADDNFLNPVAPRARASSYALATCGSRIRMSFWHAHDRSLVSPSSLRSSSRNFEQKRNCSQSSYVWCFCSCVRWKPPNCYVTHYYITKAFVWRENMLGYLSAHIIYSEKQTVVPQSCELSEEQITFKDKYLSIFSAKWRLLCLLPFKQFFCNTRSVENWGIPIGYSPYSVSWRV